MEQHPLLFYISLMIVLFLHILIDSNRSCIETFRDDRLVFREITANTLQRMNLGMAYPLAYLLSSGISPDHAFACGLYRRYGISPHPEEFTHVYLLFFLKMFYKIQPQNPLPLDSGMNG
jgi:hypothetical protein